MKHKLIFILILFVAFLLRFYQLDQFPPSLNWDEVSHSYNAYSLLKTGKDQWSVSWPIFNFRAYGDYPTTLNMYLSLPFIYFFGLNAWTTRIVSALCGFGLVVLSYFLGQEIFNKNNLSLLLMFSVAISPWTFFPSRALFQSTVAQFFFIFGFWLLLKALKKIKHLPLALFFLSLSTYAYHNTKIVVPLLFLLYFVIFFSKLKKSLMADKKIFIFSLLVLVVLMLPQALNIFNKESQARSRWVFVINPAAINQIESNRNLYSGHPLIAKIKYNRPLLFITTVTSNYLSFLNPRILFFNSTQNYQFNIPNTGVLYSVFLPFFYLGLAAFILKALKKDLLSLFLLLSFFIALIPAVVTVGDFPIIRAMTVLPFPLVFIVSGYALFSRVVKKYRYSNMIHFFFLFLLLLQSFFYLNNYFNHYSKDYSSSWQYGYQQMVSYLKENYSDYDQIMISKKYGEAHQFILFYWPWDPAAYQNDSKKDWDFHADWYWVNAFDKFIFVNDWDFKEKSQDLTSKTLLITSPGNYNEGNRLLKRINFLNDQPAFDILTND